MKGIKFYSISSYIPDKVVTNDDMSRIVDTNDEWIRTRTGIERRHFASDCTNVSMAVRAAEKALSNEDERERRLKHERMQRRVKEVEQRAPVRTPRSADKNTQFGE